MASESALVRVRDFVLHRKGTYSDFILALESVKEIEFLEDLREDELTILLKGLREAGSEKRLLYLSIVTYSLPRPCIEAFNSFINDCSYLTTLDLGGTSFSPDAKEVLLHMLRNNRIIQKIRLVHCNLEGDEIVDCLLDHPLLWYLDIGYVPLTNKGLKLLLTRFPALRYLDVRCDPELRHAKRALTCSGASGWCTALAKNTTLTYLCLRRHELGFACARLLGRALLTNTTLQHLDLSFNINLGLGAKPLVNALETNTTLRDLSMNGCYISAQDVIALASVLEKSNRSLQSLQIATAVDLNVTSSILQMLRVNWAITDLYVDTATCENREVLVLLIKNRFRRNLHTLMSAFHPRLGRCSNMSCMTSMAPRFSKLVSSFLLG